ncbi:hypothetical protein E0T84_07995 [Mycobacterium sp. DBP42]|nr:hypothetical protein E0T84_07995 [Mycobacterium sp. DBP42]
MRRPAPVGCGTCRAVTRWPSGVAAVRCSVAAALCISIRKSPGKLAATTQSTRSALP